MKKLLTKIAWMIAGLVLACFCAASTHAQADVTPDDYKRLNTVPITLESVKVDFQGNFSLPSEVQCHGHKLAPGKYTLMVKTVGNDKMVTLQREGSDVVLHSRPVTPTSVSEGPQRRAAKARTRTKLAYARRGVCGDSQIGAVPR